jgi:hypothetical protein
MSKRAEIYITVTVKDDTDVAALAEAVYDFLASDPNDVFPQIETLEDFDYLDKREQ